MRTFALLCAAMLPASVAAAQRPKPAPAVLVVRQLYADFACEAVVSVPDCDAQHQLIDQPRQVLAKYFDYRLVTLWLADRDRAARTREVGKLDFSPIWDSQDPAGTVVHILATKDSGRVEVDLYHLYSGFPVKPDTLRYSLAKSGVGWRIRDIARGKEWSLVDLLTQKP